MAASKWLTQLRNKDYTKDERPPIHVEAQQFWMETRRPGCTMCPLHEHALNRCVLGNGPMDSANVMVVGESPSRQENVEGVGPISHALWFVLNGLDDAGIDADRVYMTSTVKCYPNQDKKKSDPKLLEKASKICAPEYLAEEVRRIQPKVIISLGAVAYYHFSHKAGILKARGEPFWHEEYNAWVVPTVHPNYFDQNPAYMELFMGDFAMAKRYLDWTEAGKDAPEEPDGPRVAPPNPPMHIIPLKSLEAWESALEELQEEGDKVLTFDLETRGFKDFDQVGPGYSQVWCAALTRGRRDPDGAMRVFLLPLEHPDSPFLGNPLEDWQHNWTAEPLDLRVAKQFVDQVVQALLRLIGASRVNGHNVKFDLRNLASLARHYGLGGWWMTQARHIGFDSMNGAHIINENLSMSLRSQAGLRLGVPNWGKGKQTFGDKERPPTELFDEDGMGEYCARDTGYAHMLYEDERERLAGMRDQTKLLRHVILPGLEAYSEMELNGIFVSEKRLLDSEFDFKRQLASTFSTLKAEVDYRYMSEADQQKYSPDNLEDQIDNEHFLRRWIFSWDRRETVPDPMKPGKTREIDVFNHWGLGMAIEERTDKTDAPQIDDKVLKRLLAEAEESGNQQHIRVVKAIDVRRHATKAIQFFDAWREWGERVELPEPGWRLHPFFNLTGAVTGRRSCDRPNLQQVPRDKRLRSCIGAPKGKLFLEVDYSQIEVRLAAWAAGEETMIAVLSDPHGDIYRYTASKLADWPEEDLARELAKGNPEAKNARQKAKAVVLGFLYGMQAKSFAAYAKDMYQVEMTEKEAEEYRNTFFATFPALLRWHERMKNTAITKLEAESFIHRIRHLSAVLSNDWKVSTKAERQAINSPIQGMGGDLTLASVVSIREAILMALNTVSSDEIMVVGDVHDALLFELDRKNWRHWVRKVLEIMEGAPLLRKVFPDTFTPPLRLKAEAKVGQFWGNSLTVKEGTTDRVVEFNIEELDEIDLEAA